MKKILNKLGIKIYNGDYYIIIVKNGYEYYIKKFWVG